MGVPKELQRYRKRAVLSLIGELAFASKVVAAGRTFLRHMINTAHAQQGLNDWIRLQV